MPAPRISVAVATYNGAAHIAEQLESITSQSVPPAEVLVGDDGSTDGTVEVVQRFAEGSPVPVRLTVHESRLGYAENFLRTAEQAEGDLIAFSDQDDVWMPDKLKVAADAFADEQLML